MRWGPLPVDMQPYGYFIKLVKLNQLLPVAIVTVASGLVVPVVVLGLSTHSGVDLCSLL